MPLCVLRLFAGVVVVAAILGALFWERRRRQRKQQQQQLLPLTTESAKGYKQGSASSGRHLSTRDSDDMSDSAAGVGPRRCDRLRLLN
jgi:cytoskeletal protein RodZ